MLLVIIYKPIWVNSGTISALVSTDDSLHRRKCLKVKSLFFLNPLSGCLEEDSAV